MKEAMDALITLLSAVRRFEPSSVTDLSQLVDFDYVGNRFGLAPEIDQPVNGYPQERGQNDGDQTPTTRVGQTLFPYAVPGAARIKKRISILLSCQQYGLLFGEFPSPKRLFLFLALGLLLSWRARGGGVVGQA